MKVSGSFFLILGLAVAVAAAGQQVERTIEADPNVSVEVENLAGSVVVHGWTRAEVRVTGTLGDDVEELEITGQGSRISIEVIRE